jgi:hypothetical protein
MQGHPSMRFDSAGRSTSNENVRIKPQQHSHSNDRLQCWALIPTIETRVAVIKIPQLFLESLRMMIGPDFWNGKDTTKPCRYQLWACYRRTSEKVISYFLPSTRLKFDSMSLFQSYVWTSSLSDDEFGGKILGLLTFCATQFSPHMKQHWTAAVHPLNFPFLDHHKKEISSMIWELRTMHLSGDSESYHLQCTIKSKHLHGTLLYLIRLPYLSQ